LNLRLVDHDGFVCRTRKQRVVPAGEAGQEPSPQPSETVMTPATTRPMSPYEWLLLLLLSMLWGGSFFFNEIAVQALPPLTLVLCRASLAAAVLQLVVRLRGHRLPGGRRAWAAFAVMGLLNNVVPFSLIVWSQTHIASGLASILNATTPLWTVVLAHLFTRDERMRANKLAGVLLGFLGVVVMIGPDALAGLGTGVLAQLAMLVATFSYGSSSIFGRRFKELDPLVAAAGQLTATTFMMLPLSLLIERPWQLAAPGAAAWAAVACLALLSTALAYVLFFRILGRAGATNVQLVTFLIPITALLLGTLILGERLEPRHFFGMALIGLDLAAIDGRLQRLLPRRGGRASPSPARQLPRRP
jgi:drug/metabolite transporter (DMT)-like permease